MRKGRKIGLMLVVFLVWNGGVALGGFQIGTRYLDDRPFDPDTDVLDINESLYLTMWTDEWVGGTMGQYMWALVCDWSLASITGGEAGPDAESRVVFYGSASDLWSVPEHEDGQSGLIGVPDETLDPGLYLDKLVYTPISAGDVEVRFLEVSSNSGAIIDVPDSIVIHQIPEPVTIGLFGLGGLLLVQRKQNKRGLKRKESNDGKR